MLDTEDTAQATATALPVYADRADVLYLDAQALAFSGLDGITGEERTSRAQAMLLTLAQAHRHRAAALHQDEAQGRLLHLMSFWRLVLDMARIERDRAALPSPVSLDQDIDAILLAKLSGTARAIATTLAASTFAHLSGLDEMLPARAPIASPLH